MRPTIRGSPPKFEELFSIEKFVGASYHTLPSSYPPVEIQVPGEGCMMNETHFEIVTQVDKEEKDIGTCSTILSPLVTFLFWIC